jgi:hypothetical protein
MAQVQLEVMLSSINMYNWLTHIAVYDQEVEYLADSYKFCEGVIFMSDEETVIKGDLFIEGDLSAMMITVGGTASFWRGAPTGNIVFVPHLMDGKDRNTFEPHVGDSALCDSGAGNK